MANASSVVAAIQVIQEVAEDKLHSLDKYLLMLFMCKALFQALGMY